ncbi:hypothetical protein PGT21_008328 [Puccinia graminis f. sp. tritici]|uniref:Uncharacterized protein n=1 Tax=Puccinia graminis f. sp. tritici TaxID=56615 RepID=A0A5B0QST0_PUCGR|nr:hypothetical protein PGT21_008328 [Puccinia graminis f. sp. tritici]
MQEQEMSQQAHQPPYTPIIYDEIAAQFAKKIGSSYSYLCEDLDCCMSILGSCGYKMLPESGIHFNEIKTVVLPSLSRSLRRMQDLLTSPSYYQEGKDPDYQTGVKLLSEVDNTATRLIQLNQSLLSQDRRDDFWGPAQRWDWDMDAYRCRAMQLKIKDILRKTAEIFRETEFHFHLLSQSETMEKRNMKRQSDYHRAYHQTQLMLDSIDNAIRSFEPSDLELLKDRCQQVVQNSIAPTRMHIQSSQDALTIIKLTRLFLNKLSKATNGIPHPLPLMSSDQLLALIKAADHIDDSLRNFVFSTTIEQGPGPEQAYDLLTQVLSAIKILTDNSGRQGPSPESPYDSPRECCEWYQLFSCQLSAVVTRFTFPHLVQCQRE